jgi:hypothetical protein
MRMPGTHNTKGGQWNAVEVLELADRRYEFDDIVEWLSEQSPVMLRKSRERGKAAGKTDDFFSFERYAREHGLKPPIDVAARLKAMSYMAGGENGIHATQLAVTASLLSRGDSFDRVVPYVLEATKRAAGEYGARWNWRVEERNIRGMCETWLKKHPQEERQQRRQAELNDDDNDEDASHAADANDGANEKADASDGSTAPPSRGMGHNSKGRKDNKPQPLHIRIADAFIAGMQKGIGQPLRRVPDLDGVSHYYTYRDGLWALQSDRDVKGSLNAQLQQILNIMGKGSFSGNKLFSEASGHVLRSAEVYGNERVTFGGHGKIPTRSGLIDPRICLATGRGRAARARQRRAGMHGGRAD